MTTNVVEEAKRLWAEKGSSPGRKPSLTRDEWILIGEALAGGKEASKGKPGGFKAWRDENGFGEMDSRECSEAVWLAEDCPHDFFQLLEKNNLSHPTAIHAAYRAQLNADRGVTHQQSILQAVKSGASSMEALREATGLDTAQLTKRLTDIRRAGRIELIDGEYRITKENRQRAAKQAETDRQLADALSRAYRALEDAADNLRYHSKNSEDARLRLAAALGDSPQWGPSSTDVKANDRSDSRIQRKTVKEISPSMAAIDQVGALGNIRTLIALEVRDAKA